MGEFFGILFGVVLVGGAVFLMWRSWRRRTERDAELTAYPVPADLSTPDIDAEILYVATTFAETPLERLAVRGLAFRGAGRLEVHAEGVLLRIAGEVEPSFLPADRIVDAGAATYAIDRGVEPDGLVALTWIIAGTDPEAEPVQVDSYLRARDPGDTGRIIAAVHELAAWRPAPRPDAESEITND
ncbi:hypothetical protein ET445_11790 [Agromyces protaetiae]|uniref:PH domain-containing protein n=1 Tax=Agromyces protaetiae TaxID=2509455 RepID=A0A4P6FCX2_9MICO|nr:hypothetical protein [Agromyces protaetiae]QAY73922.1 hypothetical protein ET445_11790 [Agromyces protaetiae]